MIRIIAGGSHTGKTLLAQKLLERYRCPYLSIDHLKMGLIRSGQTPLTPEDDEELTAYLWPIVREIIKTAIENGQSLTVEGCYIPYTYRQDFPPEYRAHLRYICLIFSPHYIGEHYEEIIRYQNAIETRGDGDYPREALLEENRFALEQCQKHDCPYVLIDESYKFALPPDF